MIELGIEPISGPGSEGYKVSSLYVDFLMSLGPRGGLWRFYQPEKSCRSAWRRRGINTALSFYRRLKLKYQMEILKYRRKLPRERCGLPLFVLRIYVIQYESLHSNCYQRQRHALFSMLQMWNWLFNFPIRNFRNHFLLRIIWILLFPSSVSSRSFLCNLPDSLYLSLFALFPGLCHFRITRKIRIPKSIWNRLRLPHIAMFWHLLDMRILAIATMTTYIGIIQRYGSMFLIEL